MHRIDREPPGVMLPYRVSTSVRTSTTTRRPIRLSPPTATHVEPLTGPRCRPASNGTRPIHGGSKKRRGGQPAGAHAQRASDLRPGAAPTKPKRTPHMPIAEAIREPIERALRPSHSRQSVSQSVSRGIPTRGAPPAEEDGRMSGELTGQAYPAADLGALLRDPLRTSRTAACPRHWILYSPESRE